MKEIKTNKSITVEDIIKAKNELKQVKRKKHKPVCEKATISPEETRKPLDILN